ncbi:YceD family protein [Roseococcus sp.]|uniref:YceD family protein n=1 Tax=Roseococcus sp. TaxID=2109646 RepID=UPI003BAB27F3
MTPEFSHSVILAQVPSGGQGLRLAANPAEREALARRLGLLALHAFSAELRLVPDVERAILVTGQLTAELEQECGVTLAPVRQSVSEAVAWRLLPTGMEPSDGEDDPDDIESEQGAADLGEALAQQLSLAIDPYPRAPGAELSQLVGEQEAHGPFAALLKLKRP